MAPFSIEGASSKSGAVHSVYSQAPQERAEHPNSLARGFATWPVVRCTLSRTWVTRAFARVEHVCQPLGAAQHLRLRHLLECSQAGDVIDEKAEFSRGHLPPRRREGVVPIGKSRRRGAFNKRQVKRGHHRGGDRSHFRPLGRRMQLRRSAQEAQARVLARHLAFRLALVEASRKRCFTLSLEPDGGVVRTINNL